MKCIQRCLMAGAFAAMAASTGLAQAQAASHDHHAGAAAAPAASANLTEGEVRKVDKSGRKITLKHGPIKNLDMPAMTMVFQAADASLLDKVKAGDKVLFKAENPGGKLTVTAIQPVK